MTEQIANQETPRRRWERLDYKTSMILALENGQTFSGQTDDVSLGGVLLDVEGAQPDQSLVDQTGELQVIPFQDGLRFPCRVVRITGRLIALTFHDRQAAFGMFVSHDMLLDLLSRINNSFATSVNLEHAIDAGVRHIQKHLQSEAASLFLLEDDETTLVCRACSGPVDITGLKLDVNEGVIGKAIKQGATIVIHDVTQDPDFAMKVDQQTGFTTRSILVAPLIVQNKTLGALEVLNKRAGSLFEGHDRVVLSALASATAMAIHNARMAEDLARARSIGSEQKFRAVVENAGDGIYIHDRYGKIFDVNQTACNQTGYSRDELFSLNIAQLDVGIDFENLRETWDVGDVDPKQYPLTMESAHRRKDGTVFPMEVRISLLPAEDQGFLFVAMVRDNTRRKRAEEQLLETKRKLEANVSELTDARERIEQEVIRQIELSENLAIARDEAENATRAKSEFLASMSHEIRTPMTGVMGFADLLLERNLTPDDAEMVYKIKDSTKSLLRIINDVLDMSKMEAGKVELEYIDFHLPALVKDVTALFNEKRQKAGGGKLFLDVDLSDNFPLAANGDPTRLRQILINLIGNAMKFTEQGGITISGCLQDSGEHQFIRFEISDTGIGIKPEAIKNLFTDFTQADSTITRLYEGTGLGLSICRRLVELMGGEIGAFSEYGKGSTFWFTLPYVAATTEVSERIDISDMTAANFRATRSLHVLIVDDNKLNQQIIFANLIRFGHTASVAENGMDAVGAHERGDFDLIVMDIRMPVMSGPEATMLIRRMSGEKANIPIIALTADVMKENKKQYLETGMNAVIGKPINREELALTINKVMREEIHVPVLSAGHENEEIAPVTGGPTEEEVKALVDEFLKQIGASG